MEITKENFLKLPELPGVYKFIKNNKPIYIGKSINLKSRLNSYLLVNLGIKTRQMVLSADSLEYTLVTSELESLLLESFLIKKYKPKYNVVLKDDKHALYIIITKEELPRVITARKLEASDKNVLATFGPFPSSRNVKMILKLIRRIFPFSDHKAVASKITNKACLYSHIGLCNPCPNVINNLTDDVTKQQQIKIYRKNINNIKLVLSRKFNKVRNLIEKEMLKNSNNNNFEKALLLREKIKLLDYITQVRFSETNFLENPNFAEDVRTKELSSLNKLLNENGILIKTLTRIECFDIAHISGTNPTASMVVFVDGQKDSSQYRHFKIRQKKGSSDYDSMREIAQRRIKNLDKWDKPDLVIVDGGIGQVKIFENKLKEVNISVVGIAKHPDRLIFVNGTKVKLTGDTLNLVERIRDEAHRFARRLHHKLIAKNLLT